MDRWDLPGGDTLAGRKRDRVARFYRVATYLSSHPDGVPPDELARFLGMSRRNAYRDLKALDEELGIPVWAEGGRWGLAQAALLPAFRLTQG